MILYTVQPESIWIYLKTHEHLSSGVRPFDVGFKKPTSGYRLNSPLIRGSCLVNEYEPCLSHAG